MGCSRFNSSINNLKRSRFFLCVVSLSAAVALLLVGFGWRHTLSVRPSREYADAKVAVPSDTTLDHSTLTRRQYCAVGESREDWVAKLAEPHSALISAFVGRRGRIDHASSADEASRCALAAPSPIVISPALGDAGSRAMQLAVIEAGCPNPLRRIQKTLDATLGRIPWTTSAALQAGAGGTLSFDYLWQSPRMKEFREQVRASDTELFRCLNCSNELARLRQGSTAMDYPWTLFNSLNKSGQCWSLKGARNLHRLPVLDDLLSKSGWTLLLLVRDVRDMAIADNIGQLRRFAQSLLHASEFDFKATAIESEFGSSECVAALCSEGDAKLREQWWQYMSDAEVREVDSPPSGLHADPKQCFRRVTEQVRLWCAVTELALEWATQRVLQAADGSSPPFGFVVAHIEAIATGSLNTRNAEVDEDALRGAQDMLRAALGNTSTEFAHRVNADLLEWMGAGSPADPILGAARFWEDGADWRKWMSNSSVGAGRAGSGSSQSNVGHVKLGGGADESGAPFVATDHYGKWRNCAPSFIEHVESIALNTMVRVGYQPVHHSTPQR